MMDVEDFDVFLSDLSYPHFLNKEFTRDVEDLKDLIIDIPWLDTADTALVWSNLQLQMLLVVKMIVTLCKLSVNKFSIWYITLASKRGHYKMRA